jgi:molecular chaperone GrpE
VTDRPEETTGEESVAGEAADPSSDPAGATADESVEPTVEQQLAERTADLQRLQAEYVNYKRRVDRDRAAARTVGEISVLRSLLTVLDDIGRAEEHGQLEGGFKAVADALQQAVKSTDSRSSARLATSSIRGCTRRCSTRASRRT